MIRAALFVAAAVVAAAVGAGSAVLWLAYLEARAEREWAER